MTPSTIFFWPRFRVTPAGPEACKWEERARGNRSTGLLGATGAVGAPQGLPRERPVARTTRGAARHRLAGGAQAPPRWIRDTPTSTPDPNPAAGQDAQLDLPMHIWLGQGMAVQEELRCPPASEPFPCAPSRFDSPLLCAPQLGCSLSCQSSGPPPFFARRSLGRVIWDSHKASLWIRRFRPRHLPPTPRSTPAGGSGRGLGGSQWLPYLLGVCLPAPQPREHLLASPRPAPPGPRPERGRCPGC